MIAVLDYGIGNLRSAEKALQHVGGAARLVSRPDDVLQASAVVLPGVGAFGPCRDALRRTGLDSAAIAAVAAGRPFLGICVGLQLLYEGSEEDPGAEGLGLLEGVVRALPPGVKRPQMQWNRLGRPEGADGRGSRLLEALSPEPWVYFVHSYAPEITRSTVAICDYGGPVTAAVEMDRIWGTQFHPEKSGREGLSLLAGFARVAGEAGVS